MLFLEKWAKCRFVTENSGHKYNHIIRCILPFNVSAAGWHLVIPAASCSYKTSFQKIKYIWCRCDIYIYNMKLYDYWYIGMISQDSRCAFLFKLLLLEHLRWKMSWLVRWHSMPFVSPSALAMSSYRRLSRNNSACLGTRNLQRFHKWCRLCHG